ncbi:hypothetical protein BGZ65_007887, partial [Modicella reniformis]
MKESLFTTAPKVRVLAMEAVLMVAKSLKKLDIKLEVTVVITAAIIPQKIEFSALGVMINDKW